jgi:hypothetical protein
LGEVDECCFYLPENELDLSKKIEILINNKDLRSSLATKNLLRSKHLFTPEVLKNQLESIGVI